MGLFDFTDFMGVPITIGTFVAYPSEARGRGLERTTTQMTVGWVRELSEDGCVIEVCKRSRTGMPQGRQRARVTLSRVGMANLIVIGG